MSFPPDSSLSDEAKDLIDKLLQVNPIKRLGAGRPGTPNDLQALKSHAYFQGVNFAQLVD